MARKTVSSAASAPAPAKIVEPASLSASPRARLVKLIVSNFRCIGEDPVEIDLDDIVVLVGPNNAGKSSILRAYQIVINDESLEAEDFPDGNELKQPLIELESVVFEPPGPQWVFKDPATGEMKVRERWTWKSAGKGKRQGFDWNKNDWSDEGVPWGAPNVAQYHKPKPHRVEAFQNPDEQASEVVSMLTTVLTERITSLKGDPAKDGDELTSENASEYHALLNSLKAAQQQIVAESQTEIQKVEKELSTFVNQVFPGYAVKFDARAETDLEKCISFFKSGAKLLMGPEAGFKSSIQRQGSGARRTLLWTALRLLAETNTSKKKSKSQAETSTRAHVLLFDEPEICLHPSAVRESCATLYDLAGRENWQVMVTTHSPAFIDLARDNTSIVRVEREPNGAIKGTNLFRPSAASLDEDDKKRLKLLNIYDPYVAEFFFGGLNIVVEGDTEYTAFQFVISQNPESYRGIHIIRARGKATICSLVKILNHFGTSYSVLHDSDRPLTTKGTTNPAWSLNESIRQAVNSCSDPSRVRLLASLPNFEAAYLGLEVSSDKPYNAIEALANDKAAFDSVRQLLDSLIDFSIQPPSNCVSRNTLAELKDALVS